jgi:hypothetical protein
MAFYGAQCSQVGGMKAMARRRGWSSQIEVETEIAMETFG